ncbi:MAG: NAD(P)-dependent oxidoreductase [Thermomicrobiales bacterium]|nr:NAD(P)-dependent oxidoreductase [Thermomicrobiales bacterium]
MSTLPVIGFVGTGKMGLPMTRNLLAAGYTVVAFNRSPESLAEAASAGATAATSLADVAAQADIILSSLTNQQSVRDVYLGNGGLIDNARPGQVLIDTSTNDIALMREIAELAVAKSASFLDSPVSGGVPGAVAASLTVMVGGDESVYNQVLPVLQVIGGNVHHLGPSGAGTAMKLVNQLLCGVNMAAVAEGLLFGASAGASPQKILEVISTSFGGSRMLDRGIPLIIERDFKPATPVDLIRKDLGIVMDAARDSGLPLGVTSAAFDLYDRTSNDGFGPNDMTAIVIPLEDGAGIKIS